MQLTTPRKAALTTISAIGLVGALFAPAAGATGKADAPGQEKKAEAAATTWTEDNDTNDGGTPNNVVDHGDNRHPSGKDRSVEHGKSGNQGKATSDPDNNGKGPERHSGGADKPNGKGGLDKADQDGNNGCGNDDDFEDDNEGWCGRKPKSAKPTKPATTPTTQKPAAKPKHEHPKGGENGKPAAGPKASGPKAPKDRTPKANPGNGTATIAVDVTCRTVTVTSSKDISNVVVVFADGTSRKFDGLRGHSWTRTFDKDLASATAKSATSRVTGVAACGTTTGAPGDTTTPTAACPEGMVDTNGSMPGGCVLPGSAEVPCPAGTVDTNGSMPGGCEAPGGTTTGGGAKAGEGTQPADGEVLGNAAERPATVSAASTGGAELFRVGSLAFTGFSTLLLLAVALGLLALGYVLVRSTRQEVPVRD